MGWDGKKKREKENISDNSFLVKFQKSPICQQKIFLWNRLISLKLPKLHLLISFPGFDHLACQFITVAHILKLNKHPACHIHLCYMKESSDWMSVVNQGLQVCPSLPFCRTPAGQLDACILILSHWLPGYISLSHVQSLVFSVMKPTVMIFRKLIRPSNEAIDSHPRT